MNDLIERLEAAEGPDRELGLAISIACGMETPHLCPTASIDAALKLVPEGWWLAGLSFSHPDFRSFQDREWHAEIAGPVSWVEYDGFPEPEFNCEGGNAATPALALCAAALRAREASRG